MNGPRLFLRLCAGRMFVEQPVYSLHQSSFLVRLIPTKPVNKDQRKPGHQQVTRIINRPVDFGDVIAGDRHCDAAPLRIDYADGTAQVIERALLGQIDLNAFSFSFACFILILEQGSASSIARGTGVPLPMRSTLEACAPS